MQSVFGYPLSQGLPPSPEGEVHSEAGFLWPPTWGGVLLQAYLLIIGMVQFHWVGDLKITDNLNFLLLEFLQSGRMLHEASVVTGRWPRSSPHHRTGILSLTVSRESQPGHEFFPPGLMEMSVIRGSLTACLHSGVRTIPLEERKQTALE